jgi:hypothetical protein
MVQGDGRDHRDRSAGAVAPAEERKMAHSFSKLSLVAGAAIALIGLLHNPAEAASPFDGTWQMDAPGAGGSTPAQNYRCPALRLQFQIKDGQLDGHFGRNPFNTQEVDDTEGRAGSPFSGTVKPDGSMAAQWERIQSTGKLAGNGGEMRWSGACGARVAQLSRVQ